MPRKAQNTRERQTLCFRPSVKVLVMVFFFMWIRWTLPRFRYDQVMNLGWRKLLPAAILNLVFYAIVIALIELGILSLAAHRGGMIRHTEIRGDTVVATDHGDDHD